MKQLSSTAVRALREQMEGDVLLPEDPAYDAARAVWNGRFDPRPIAVVRCARAQDAAAAVVFARDHELPLSVKGGGHSYAGHGVGDGALAIDLSLMNSVEVDAERKIAIVGPGTTWAEFDSAAQAFGLATTGATVSSVGVAGFVLGGGSGYLARMYGLGLDNLLSAEVVSADGQVLQASEEEHEDLFWALRGGSGNFGVITSFTFRLYRVGPEVVTAQAFYPMDKAREVLRFYREFMSSAQDELTVYAFALRVPPVEPFPEAYQGKPALALVGFHCGDTSRGEEVLQSLKDFDEPFFAAVQTVKYTAAQQAFDAGMPKGLRWYSRAHYLNEISDDAIETFTRHVEAMPGPFTMAYFEPLGGAIGQVNASATAFPHREARYGLHILPGWTDPSDDETLMDWAGEIHDAMVPFATGGVYVNLLGEDEGGRVPSAYAENYDRLTRVKAEWDPENIFCLTHNIPPHT